MAIPVLIVSGFLGCGKTSFLRHLLPLCEDAHLRPALIINEVGDVDVDGELLADLHAEQVRLVGGCVCCTLQAQLTETIYGVLERKSGDIIIIECSGLSNPLDVVNALSAPALLRELAVSHILCLLDAGRAEKILNGIELAKSQAITADILILNKTDRLEPGQQATVGTFIDGLSCKGDLHWTTYGDIGRENMLRLLTDAAPTACTCGFGCEHHHDHGNGHDHKHELPASFCTVALSLPEEIEYDALKTLMDSLPPNVVRAKGFANVQAQGWQILHKVYDSVDIMPLSGPAPRIGGVLVCIGQHLDSDALRRLIR